jgi:hypothetical protein
MKAAKSASRWRALHRTTVITTGIKERVTITKKLRSITRNVRVNRDEKRETFRKRKRGADGSPFPFAVVVSGGAL